jgi:cell division protein FtsW (lipid II flippase)
MERSLALGLLSIYNLESSGLVRSNDPLFFKSLLSLLLGLISIVGLYSFDYRKIRSFSWVIYMGTVCFMVLALLFGSKHGGILVLNLIFLAPSIP